ncbi:MAG: sulfite exporter TauE/SafE family protein, partial [Calditrichia bacterium]|nr:sulfite exporter TauE/SafE family protein [Calditrichia bacterium]
MKNKILTLFILSILLFTFSWAASAEDYMSANFYVSQNKISAGQSFKIAVEFELNEEYHINSNDPGEDFSIPTKLTVNLPEGFTLGRIIYPESHSVQFAFSDTPLDVFEGKNIIWATVSTPAQIDIDTLQVEFSLFFQACNDQSCFAPTSYDDVIKLPATNNVNEIQALDADFFKNYPAMQTEEQESDSGLASSLQEKGLFLFLFIVFFAGLALNLTPCVYPLIPITIAYFSNQAHEKRSTTTIHAFFYFLGIVIMYSSLGLFAALSGSLLGAWLQNPIVMIIIALVMVALALSMFGVWEIRVPQKLANTAGKSRVGYIGTLLMGITVGFIAAPCIGPFVLGLITLVAEIANPVIGFVMFLALAMGIGLPYLLLGIFSGAMNKIPSSGGWMIWVKNLFGFVLLGMGIYFLNPLINNEMIYFILLGLIAAAAGVYCFIDKNTIFTNPKMFKGIKVVIGVILIALGIYLGYPQPAAKKVDIA